MDADGANAMGLLAGCEEALATVRAERDELRAAVARMAETMEEWARIIRSDLAATAGPEDQLGGVHGDAVPAGTHSGEQGRQASGDSPTTAGPKEET